MKKNKFLSVLMAVLMVLSMVVTAGAATFEDVPEERYSWAQEAIESMAENEIIIGYEDGTFRPENTVTKLEALVLSARILGFNDKANEIIRDLSIEIYGEKVAEYDLNYGDEEICYLLYKNVLKVSELTDYIEKSNASSGMKRSEIAILLTKSLDAEDEVSKTLQTDLKYTDVEKIPSHARKYVDYVTKEGLMNGMDDGSFSPDTDVTRAQIATLMYKLKNKTNYSYYTGLVTEMDNSSRNITIKADGNIYKYNVVSDVILRYEGSEISVNDISSEYAATVTLQGNSLYAIDFTTPLVDKEVYGSVSSVSLGDKPSVSIYVIEDNDTELSTDTKEVFPIDSTVAISYNDEEASLNQFKNGTYVNISIQQGVVTALRGYDKNATISGRVTDVELSPLCKIYIEKNNGTEEGYLVSSNATVSRNGKTVLASEVLSGDSVVVKTTYGRITDISATSKKQEKAGVIEEVIISVSPRITLKTSSGSETFKITNACEITIPGKATTSFYDLRAGVPATLTLEGDTVIKLTTELSEGITQITGTVTSVNVSYGVIQVRFVDPTSGVSVIEPVFVKSKATIIDIVSGKSLKLSGVKEGSKITAFGSRDNGIFEATTINISNN